MFDIQKQNESKSPTIPAFQGRNPALDQDRVLLAKVVNILEQAGSRLRSAFTRDARVGSLEKLVTRIQENEGVSAPILREFLSQARPTAQWDEDEFEGGALPPGEWRVTDPVEGNVNFIHGMTDWCTTATLVRDNRAVLTAAVHDPLAGTTYTALLGDGAYQEDVRLQASAKSELNSGLVGTGQAKPGEDDETHRRTAASIAAMLKVGLVLRVSVPATLQLVQVAAGRMDVFWQASQVRSGLLAGGLLVAEAGGTVTDMQGQPWHLGSKDFLAAAPQLHRAVVFAFSSLN